MILSQYLIFSLIKCRDCIEFLPKNNTNELTKIEARVTYPGNNVSCNDEYFQIYITPKFF